MKSPTSRLCWCAKPSLVSVLRTKRVLTTPTAHRWAQPKLRWPARSWAGTTVRLKSRLTSMRSGMRKPQARRKKPPGTTSSPLTRKPSHRKQQSSPVVWKVTCRLISTRKRTNSSRSCRPTRRKSPAVKRPRMPSKPLALCCRNSSAAPLTWRRLTWPSGPALKRLTKTPRVTTSITACVNSVWPRLPTVSRCTVVSCRTPLLSWCSLNMPVTRCVWPRWWRNVRWWSTPTTPSVWAKMARLTSR